MVTPQTAAEEGFIRVLDEQTLDGLFARSNEAPVVLFIHSTQCPISAAAYREMSGMRDETAIIIVQRGADVMREAERRTGVEHHSPRVIILRDGRAAWTATHYDITQDAVREAVSMNA